MRRTKKTSGFSMIELVIVIIILGIISIPIYINWEESTTILDQQTEILVNHLRYTQNISMSKNRKCRLVITSPTTYVIRDNNNIDQPIPNVPNGQPAELDPDVSFELPPVGFTNTIIFNGKGVPYTDTTTISKLTTEAQITLLHASGRTRTVNIVPRTGKISSS